MDGLTLGAWMAFAGLAGGVIGALIGGKGVLDLVIRNWPAVLARIKAQVEMDDVLVRVRVDDPPPVVVETVTAPLPSNQEMAERVFAEFPNIGPRALARILRCSPATASALIADRELAPAGRVQVLNGNGTEKE